MALDVMVSQMAGHLSAEFRRGIMERLATFEESEIRELLIVSESFPDAGSAGEEQDDVAQTLHDIALHAESLADWDACGALYQRVLRYPVREISIHVGAKFRLAICLENLGALRKATNAYRETLSYGEVWPDVAAQARNRLAMLLMAAEEYEEAIEHLFALDARPLPVDVHRDPVQICIAKCLVRLGRLREAEDRLNSLRNGTPSSEASLEALKLLGFIHEQLGDTASAVNSYKLLLQLAASNPIHQQLAMQRLARLTASST